MSKISIIDYRPIGKGALVAVFDMRLNQTSMVFRECKLFRKQDTGARWIVLPQKSWKGDDGKLKYAALVEFEDKAMGKRFQDAVLAALDAYLKN